MTNAIEAAAEEIKKIYIVLYRVLNCERVTLGEKVRAEKSADEKIQKILEDLIAHKVPTSFQEAQARVAQIKVKLLEQQLKSQSEPTDGGYDYTWDSKKLEWVKSAYYDPNTGRFYDSSGEEIERTAPVQTDPGDERPAYTSKRNPYDEGYYQAYEEVSKMLVCNELVSPRDAPLSGSHGKQYYYFVRNVLKDLSI